MIEIQEIKKRCSKCGIEKEFKEFNLSKDGKYKLHNYCRECNKYLSKQYCLTDKYKKYKLSEECKSVQGIWRKKNFEKLKINSKKWREENPYRYWAIGTINRHKRKGFTILSTIDEIEFLAKRIKNCSYCNIELDWSWGNKGPKLNSPSLDRINNEKELRKDNIQIICYDCNAVKRTKTH